MKAKILFFLYRTFSSSADLSQGQTSSSSSSKSASVNVIQTTNSPSSSSAKTGATSVIVLAGSAKHPKLTVTSDASGSASTAEEGSSISKTSSSLPGYMGTCSVIAKAGQYNAAHADHQRVMASHYYGSAEKHDALLGRWRLSLELYGRLFVDDVGLEPGSIMPELSGFPIKESKFRREMERLRNSSSGGGGGHGHGHSSASGSGGSSSGSSNATRDLFLKVDRERSLLLAQTFKELNAVFSGHTRRLPSNATPSPSHLAITRVKVTFREEPGEGSGVARGFYTAFSEAVLANEKLPALDWVPAPGGSLGSNLTKGGSSGFGGSREYNISNQHHNYQFNLIRVANASGASSGSSSLAQAVTNALQGASSGAGSSGSAPGTSSSSAPSGQGASSAQRAQDAESPRRPRSPSSRMRLFTTRRSHIERIRSELRSSALEDFRRSNSGGVSSGGSSSAGASGRHRNNSGPVLRYESPPFVPTSYGSLSRGGGSSVSSPSTGSSPSSLPVLATSDSRVTLGMFFS